MLCTVYYKYFMGFISKNKDPIIKLTRDICTSNVTVDGNLYSNNVVVIVK